MRLPCPDRAQPKYLIRGLETAPALAIPRGSQRDSRSHGKLYTRLTDVSLSVRLKPATGLVLLWVL